MVQGQAIALVVFDMAGTTIEDVAIARVTFAKVSGRDDNAAANGLPGLARRSDDTLRRMLSAF